MTVVRVKICGITRVEDGRRAAELGADAIGLVFYAHSPRHVSVEQAAAIAAALPPFVSKVGLFVDAEEAEIRHVLARVPLDYLQFHGDEPPEFCTRFARPFLKVLRMRAGRDVIDYAARYPAATGLLLDAYRQGVPGGTGETFDWARIPRDLPLPLVLAGGLTPDNVAAAVREVQPWAVDVSGGVEASPGVKDAGKMAAFIRAAKAAQTQPDGNA
ncbi:MAG TPA: phosphoribosylanthranilate isomerase [Gammaproteobacteria bacterium]|nr:phosphoribosylanthranilate isomerase [Gammaproteobacteria bacterium]